MHTSVLFVDREGGIGTGIFAGGRLPAMQQWFCIKDYVVKKNQGNIEHVTTFHGPSVPTGQFGALVGASNRSKIDWSAFMIEIENPKNERPSA